MVKKDSAHTHTPQSLSLQSLGFSLKKHSVLHSTVSYIAREKETSEQGRIQPFARRSDSLGPRLDLLQLLGLGLRRERVNSGLFSLSTFGHCVDKTLKCPW